MSSTHETTRETAWPVLVQTLDGLDYAWPWELEGHEREIVAHRRVIAVVLRRASQSPRTRPRSHSFTQRIDWRRSRILCQIFRASRTRE